MGLFSFFLWKNTQFKLSSKTVKTPEDNWRSSSQASAECKSEAPTSAQMFILCEIAGDVTGSNEGSNEVMVSE
jgi:hypothetical protein